MKDLEEIAQEMRTTFDKVWDATLSQVAGDAAKMMDEDEFRQRLLRQKTPSGVS